MSKLVFIADDRITDIPDQNDDPDMIQVTGSCKDTNLTLLTVRLSNGGPSGNINLKKSAGVISVPKQKFHELRDCFDKFLIEIELNGNDNGANFALSDVVSRPVPQGVALEAKMAAKSSRIERDARDIIQTNAELARLVKSAFHRAE